MYYYILTMILVGMAMATEAAQPVDPDYIKLVNLKSLNGLTRNSDPNFRLSRDVVPSAYDLNITPYFDTDNELKFTVTGLVSIVIHAKRDQINEVILHSANITINNITLVLVNDDDDQDSIATNWILDENYEFLRISLNTYLIPYQEYNLTIQYQGNIQSNHVMEGFYRSWYKDSNGVVRWMGTTQFQPTAARKAFPCFDEPYFKAIFNIAINRPVDFSPSISNMPIQSTNPDVIIDEEPRVEEKFYPTPIMSTYLIAFIVSEYVPHDEVTGSRPFAVFGRSSAIPQGQYAHDVGIELLQAMDDYTNFSYYEMGDNMKMHQAAIPDFSAGAMENWGLLTYREALILNDNELTSSSYKQRIANIISHEIAHMWFGNLVTCDWWSNLWLNEGFARYYQYFLTHMVEIDFEYDIQYVVDQVRTALFSDSLASSHALTYYETNSPTEIWNMFSVQSYNKGSAVIRMMEFLLGTSTFVNGLRSYLKTNSFSSALPPDLYSALDAEAVKDGVLERYGVTVSSVMSTWVDKSGYPLITVTVNQTSNNIFVSQRRFFRESPGPLTNDLYFVPLTFTTEAAKDWDNTTVDYVLTVRQTTISRNTNQEGWVIFNKRGTGFYRVNYDDDNWERIFSTLNNSATIDDIDQLNRALIVDDLFHLARAGVVSYVTLLRYLEFLQHETSYPVWVNALNGFAFLQRRLAHIPVVLNLLQEFMLELMTKVITELGFNEIESDSHLTKLHRAQIMNAACSLGHEGCTSFADAAYDAFTTSGSIANVSPNSRIWIFCAALRANREGRYDFLWRRFQSSNVYNEKIEILSALGCTPDAVKLSEFLDNIFNDDIESGIRAQDVSVALSSAITGNEANTEIVLNWLTRNYTKVMQNYYGLDGVATVVSSLAGRVIYERHIDALEDLIMDAPELLPLVGAMRAWTASARENLNWSVSRLEDITTGLSGSVGLKFSAVLFFVSVSLALLSQLSFGYY